jgi:hypothetical protein
MPHQPGTPSQSKHSSPRGSLVDGHKPTLSRYVINYRGIVNHKEIEYAT